MGVTGDGSIEPIAGGSGVEEGKIVKLEKKQKKEKKMKEKGLKKKKKVVGVAVVEAVTTTAVVEEPDLIKQGVPDTTTPTSVAPKLGKKRKQAVALEGEQPMEKDAEKPKKKKKKKYQPEVVVQPWADLEEEEEVTTEEKKVQDDKEIKEDDQDKEDKLLATEKSADEMFSDWSDGDSPLGEDSWFDENDQRSPSTQKTDDTPSAAAAPAKPSPSSEDRGPSFDDVYDPISDDEFEAMYTQSDEEEEKKEKKDANKGLGIEDVDWSSLGLSQQPEKGMATLFASIGNPL